MYGDIGGSIDEYEIAIGSDTSDEIGGSSALTFDGSTMSITGDVTATGDISAVDVTATGVTATPTLSITGGVVGSLNSTFVGAAPTDGATAGTEGDILFDDIAIYVCTVTGVAGAATWKRVVLVDLA